MVKFEKNDFNLVEIEKLGKFSDLKTKKSFEIKGGHQENNPAIGLRYNMDKYPSNQIEDELTAFFKGNGVELVTEHDEIDNFLICLRYDIRENPKLATNILKTIIFHLEGGLELDVNFKIPGLNKFVNTETE